MEKPEMNLHQKLFEITQRVNNLKKDTAIEFGSTKYNAITEGHVLKVFKPLYAEFRLMLYPCDCHSIQAGKVTVTDYIFKVIDVDTNESTFVAVSGGGHDGADKGPGKASTYALKYGFLKLHNVITGDDPDLVSSDEILAKEKEETKNPSAQSETKPPVKTEDEEEDVSAPLKPTLKVIDKYIALPGAEILMLRAFRQGIINRYAAKDYNTADCYSLANMLGDNEAYKDAARLEKALKLVQS